MTTRPTVADLQFDPVAHVYTLHGERVPSVTEILAAVKVSTDFEELATLSARVAGNIERARALGRAVHADAHAYDDGDIDLSTVHPDVAPYLAAWVTFRENLQIDPVLRERCVFHSDLWFAGTLDGVFRDRHTGRLILLDIKTGDPDDAGCRFQTAAYAVAVEREQGIVIAERWGVQLIPGRKIPYDIRPYRDFRDWLAFQAFITTYHCQAARRREARTR